MRTTTVAVWVSVLVAAGLAGAQPAQASATLYVNEAAASCSNSGPGSQAEPFCSIQAAANAVMAGQTVDIEGSGSTEYREAVVITHSGTAGDPITFTGAGSPPAVPAPLIDPTSGAPITLSGVHDVDISGLHLRNGNADGVDLTGSQDVALDNMSIVQQGSTTAQLNGITIDGTSSGVTVSRSQISESHGFGIRSQAGAQQIEITASIVYAGGISLSGTSGAAVTGDSVIGGCGGAIGIDGGGAAVVENNIGIGGCQTAGSGVLSVAADSVLGVHADYNAFRSPSPDAEYFWGGQQYATAAAFFAATGQGAHDIDGTSANLASAQPEGSPLIDSADCNAPGELSTDRSGQPRVDDPLITDAGAGSCHADRGAVERQDMLSTAFTTSPAPPQSPVPLDLGVAVPSATTSPWNEPVTYVVDFGDGSGPGQVTAGGTAAHTYAVPGLYPLTVTAADTGGTTLSAQRQVVVATATAPDVTFTAGPSITQAQSGPAIGPDSAGFSISAGADNWELASGTIDFGDGSSQGIGKSLTWNHLYPKPGTYTATLTETDLLGRTSTATAKVTVGDEFLPHGPFVDYNSRDNGIDKVPAHAVIKLSMTRLQAAASGVPAAYVNVTVSNAKASGSVTVYPDGTSRPNEASVQFQAGRTASNKALAVPGSDHLVDFYNGSSGPIDLAVDTYGLDINGISLGDTYAPDGPVRVLSKAPVTAGGHVTFTVAGIHGVPAGADAVVLDVTAMDTTAGGYLTAYAGGTANPGIRDAAWAAGQTVTCQALVPLRNGQVVLHDSSSGSAVLSADLVGYYEYASTGSVFLPSRHRLLDTLTGTGTGGLVAKIAPGRTLNLQVSGKNGLPVSGISAVAVNLTASGAATGGFIEGFPDGISRPTARSVSYGTRSARANSTIVPVGSDGVIKLYNGGSSGVNLIVDLTGFYYQYPSLP